MQEQPGEDDPEHAGLIDGATVGDGPGGVVEHIAGMAPDNVVIERIGLRIYRSGDVGNGW